MTQPTLFTKYPEWRESVLQDLEDQVEETDETLDCPDCDGEGEIHGECECCGQGTETECETCDGTGELDADHLSVIQHHTQTARYFHAVVTDLRRYAAYTGKDFLGVVAPFITYYRKELR